MKNIVKPGQALNQIQNELLLLFLKYKLALRSNLKELKEIPLSEDTLRNIIIHSMFHAVFGNKSEKAPYLEVQFKKEKSYLELQICSTGDAASFSSSIESFCNDHFFCKYTTVEFSVFEMPRLAGIDVQQRPNYGSIIRLMFLYS